MSNVHRIVRQEISYLLLTALGTTLREKVMNLSLAERDFDQYGGIERQQLVYLRRGAVQRHQGDINLYEAQIADVRSQKGCT